MLKEGTEAMRLIVTGGAGFIGSAVIRFLIKESGFQVLNLDKLTYAGNLDSLAECADHPNYKFVHGDICDSRLVSRVFSEFQPDAVMHLAAESHVDRSIDGPADFIHTNIVGTAVLLEVARGYWSGLPEARKAEFRFHHVSTDEVFGTLGSDGLFSESTPYNPSSPYSASKAASDHLVRAWHRTYQLPVVVTNCSNNYGPYQFPEKLIPLMILNCIERKPLPVYGSGQQVRDWLYVDDHARALVAVLTSGELGETYNIGGHNEVANIGVVRTICDILDEISPRPKVAGSHRELITHVPDRPGHDMRYAIDASKIARSLGWAPRETFETGLRKTVSWYLENLDWSRRVQDGSYKRQRLGLGHVSTEGSVA